MKNKTPFPIMINAALVSAQNRKRLFWTNIPNVTQPEDRDILLKDILEKEVDEKYQVKGITMSGTFGNRRIAENDKAYCLAANPSSDQQPRVSIRIGQIGKGGQGDRIYSQEGKSVALSAQGGGRGAKTGLYEIPMKEKSFCIDANYHKGTSVENYLNKGRRQLVPDNTQIRKLTPTECMRLQGLPDGYCDGVSNSQQYKMLGNGFCVDVVSHILSFINKPVTKKD